MKIREFTQNIRETPLPDEWDKEMFSPRASFSRMVAYAKERAKQVGRGSSRVAFKIDYQGRPTVLKVAVNNKGITQNQEETQLLDDYYVENIGITIPMIDHDEDNGDRITWIHTEFAEKLTQKQLEKFFGGIDMFKITAYLDSQTGKSRNTVGDIPKEIIENEYFQNLQDLVVNFGLPAVDLARKANWGLYRGDPVIIDLGYTDATAKLYQR